MRPGSSFRWEEALNSAVLTDPELSIYGSQENWEERGYNKDASQPQFDSVRGSFYIYSVKFEREGCQTLSMFTDGQGPTSVERGQA